MSVDISKIRTSNDKATQEQIVAVHRWTDKLLTFKSTRPDGYRFVPGQFARLGLLVNGEMVWRAYSITSAIAEDILEYYAIVVPSGAFTSQLHHIQVGDPVWVEKLSYGFMTADRFVDGCDLWMLATGTGIGPYISILQQREVWEKFRHLVLVHGVRHAQELAYQEKCYALREQAVALKLPAKLHLIQAITRDGGISQHGYLNGRITTLLRDGTLERVVGLDINVASSRVMICGNPDMITEVREILRQRGLGPCRRHTAGQFITEDYW